jgi:hypothetical protein
MQPAGGETEQKAQVLLRWFTTLEPKISFETHTFGAEYQHASTHPDRCRGDGWDAEFRTTSKGAAPDVDGKEVKPIDKQINAVKERVKVVRTYSLGESSDCHGRVDDSGHFLENVDLWPADCVDCRADLAIEIRQIEAVKVRDPECPDPKASQCQEVGPTNSAHSRDRNTLPAKRHLFRLGEPAEVPFEGKLIVELGSGHSAP